MPTRGWKRMPRKVISSRSATAGKRNAAAGRAASGGHPAAGPESASADAGQPACELAEVLRDAAQLRGGALELAERVRLLARRRGDGFGAGAVALRDVRDA